MLCQRCSYSNPEENKFCGNCGAFLVRTGQAGQEAPTAPAVPSFARKVEAVEGTEVLLAAAAANGVEKTFANLH